MNIIETERLILRSFTEDDTADLFAYLHEPTVNCFSSMILDNIEDARKGALERSEDPELYFAIELKESGTLIGEIYSHCESMAPDIINDTYSSSWMLGKEDQGKGYMYEAAYAYFEYLFHEKDARRIYVYTEEDNIACQKLSEKLGMRKEGLFKEFISFVNNQDGTPHYENTYQYAILKHEWRQR